ncbi:MAG: hypothetical protein H6668_24395 [Ardenticatenaceae bacterium]|nr:hypothetical protein [Ardenticatenaceae bacterium]
MLVAGGKTAVVIAPTTRFGEYALVRQTVGVETVRRTNDVGFVIFVDDGSTVVHEDQPQLLYAGEKRGHGEPTVWLLQRLPLGEHKELSRCCRRVGVAERPLPNLPVTSQLAIATFNVENLFDNHRSPSFKPAASYRSQYDQKQQAGRGDCGAGAPRSLACRR